MSVTETRSLDYLARKLVQNLATSLEYGEIGSASVSIYDTAWVSMITKDYDDQPQWLFPESFQFLLDTQLPDGSWESYASLEDGILNTLASLLALVRHSKANLKDPENDSHHLSTRIEKAQQALEGKFQTRDVEFGVSVGLEILIPTLLTALDEEHIDFSFPQKKLLQDLKDVKMTKFNPQLLYQTQTTYLHSLEAFVGVVDFDRLSQQKGFGSMMGSPASTAVYIMNCSTWDNEAESYLRKVVKMGQGKGCGGVPSFFQCLFSRLHGYEVYAEIALIDDMLTSKGSFYPPARQFLNRSFRTTTSFYDKELSTDPIRTTGMPCWIW